MKKITPLLLFALLAFSNAFAQSENSTLSFMIGKWKGSGWMMKQSGKQFTNITENVACKINCAVFAVDGLGTMLDSLSKKEIVVHEAFGIISLDKAKNKWIMRAYREGEITDAEIVLVGEKTVRWELLLPNNSGTMRFTTDYSESNKWKGLGEYSRDGKSWTKIMETELTKVSD